MESILLLIYFGTYTSGDSQGIYVGEFNTKSGQIQNVRLAGESENPSFLEIHPSGKTLYSVSETADGAVSSWRINPDGSLKLLNTKPAEGDAPCFVCVSPNGRYVGVANYTSGNLIMFRAESDGRLGERCAMIQHTGSSVNKQRQNSPHAHSIQFSPDGKYVLAADLGIDQLLVYRVEPDGNLIGLESGKLAPGAGPRHFAFSADGRHVFVINELNCTATTFAFDDGKLTREQTVSTLPEPFQQGYSTAEILLHPSGKYVYGSNRGHDSITAFSADTRGKLAQVSNFPSGGKTPRNFRISDDGNWLITANQSSSDVFVFKVDLGTGKTKQVFETTVPNPVCVRFLSARKKR